MAYDAYIIAWFVVFTHTVALKTITSNLCKFDKSIIYVCPLYNIALMTNHQNLR